MRFFNFRSCVLVPRGDRPRAKAVVDLQGCRSRRSWGASTKKRVDLGSLFDVEHETTPPFVDAPQLRTVPKIKCDVSGRKPAQTRQKKIWNFFWVESTEAQPRGTDGHREAPMRLDSNTPENGHFSAGGSVHRPFSSESVKIFHHHVR